LFTTIISNQDVLLSKTPKKWVFYDKIVMISKKTWKKFSLEMG